MMNTKMEDYINSLTENMEVEGDFYFLKVEESQKETDGAEETTE